MKDPKKYYRNIGNKKYKQRYKRERLQDPEFVIRGEKVLFEELITDDFWNPFGTNHPIEAKDILQGNYFLLNEEEEFNSRLTDESDFEESLLFDDGYQDAFELKLSKFEKKLIQNLQDAFINSDIKNDLKQESLEKRLFKHYKTLEDKVISNKNFQTLFYNEYQFEINKNQILNSTKSYLGYLKLLLFSPFWVKSPSDWHEELGISIGEFTFGKYKIPAIFNRIWEDKTHIPIKYYYYYILLAQGGSFKRFSKKANLKLNEATIYHLFQISEEMPIDTAFKYARILCKGGTIRDLTLFSNAYLIDHLEENNSFESKSLDWMIKYGTKLSNEEYLLILNWAKHEKSEAERNQLGYEIHRERIAHQLLKEEDKKHFKPFRWKVRTLNRTLEKARSYYQSILEDADKYYEWTKHNLDWEYKYKESNWNFVELTSSEELNKEGNKLLHCVGSYAFFCSNEMSAIVSLKKNGDSALTIEINLGANNIVQVRGFSNRLPNEEEKEVLAAWIKEKGLIVYF